MKNYGDLGGCYPPWPTASTDNTLLDLHNISYDTQPRSLISLVSLSLLLSSFLMNHVTNLAKATYISLSR